MRITPIRRDGLQWLVMTDIDQRTELFSVDDSVDQSLLVPGVEVEADVLGDVIDGVHVLETGDPRPAWRAWGESVGACDALADIENKLHG
jgi:hypothetical protein